MVSKESLGLCSVRGCEKPLWRNKNLCVMHLRRLERHGDVHHGPTTGCKVPYCQEPHEAKGLCAKHYRAKYIAPALNLRRRVERFLTKQAPRNQIAKDAFTLDSHYVIEIAEAASRVMDDLKWLEEAQGMTREEAIDFHSNYSEVGFRTYRARATNS